MSRGPDAATLLERALLAAAAQAGCPVTLHDSGWTHWASATYVGARHELQLEAADTPAHARWLKALPEADFALRGHLVADLVVARVHRSRGRATVTLEVLTVEER